MRDPSIFVVADGGKVGEEVFACLCTWSAAGWLRPVLWIPVSEDGSRGQERLIVEGEVQSRSFSQHLGRRADGFRVLCAQFVPNGEQLDAVRAAAKTLAREVAKAASSAHQPLVRISLLVPSSVLSPVPVSAFFGGAEAWEVNAVVSPEDRQDDEFADVGVALGKGYAEHAALAVATTAGLWSGSSVSPFDGAEVELSHADEPLVESVRCFGRIVEGPLMVERVLQQIVPYFEGHEAWRVPAARLLGGEIVESERREIERTRREFLRSPDGARLRFTPPPPFEEPARTVIGLFRALWDFVVFLARGFITAPIRAFYRAFDRLATRAEAWAQRMVYGSLEQSSMEIRLGRRRVAMYVQSAPGASSSEEEELDDDGIHRAEAPLWKALRAVSLGLIDGGQFPDAVSAPRLGGRPGFVGDRALVIPVPPPEPETLAALFGPALPPDRDPEKHVGLIDVGNLIDMQAWLQRRVAESREEPPQATLVVGHPDGTDDSQDGDASVMPEPSTSPAATSAPTPADLEAALERLDAIIGEREPSLLWQIAKAVRDQVRAARSVADAAATEERTAGKELEDLQTEYSEKFGEGKGLKRRRRRTRWLTVGILVLLAPIGIYLFAKREATEDLLPNLAALFTGGGMTPLLWSALGQFAGFAIGARVLAWLIEELRYLRLIYHVSNQQLLVFAKQSYLRTALAHVRAEEVRLKRIYERLLLWGEAIALLLHRPLGPIREVIPDGAGPAREPVRLPMALQVAEGRASDASLRKRSAGIAREHLKPGWIGNRLTAFADQLREDEAAQIGLDGKSLPWDLDSSLTGNELRALVEELRSGSLGVRWWAELRQGVFADLAKSEPNKLFDSLEGFAAASGRGGPQADSTDAVEFLTEIYPTGRPGQIGGDRMGIWRGEAYADEAAVCRAVTIWAPFQFMPQPTADESKVVVPAEATVAADGSFAIMVMRMDRTERRPASGLRIVKPAPTATARPQRPEPDHMGKG